MIALLVKKFRRSHRLNKYLINYRIPPIRKLTYSKCFSSERVQVTKVFAVLTKHFRWEPLTLAGSSPKVNTAVNFLSRMRETHFITAVRVGGSSLIDRKPLRLLGDFWALKSFIVSHYNKNYRDDWSSGVFLAFNVINPLWSYFYSFKVVNTA